MAQPLAEGESSFEMRFQTIPAPSVRGVPWFFKRLCRRRRCKPAGEAAPTGYRPSLMQTSGASPEEVTTSGNLEAKKQVVEEIKAKIQASKAVVLANYNRLTV